MKPGESFYDRHIANNTSCCEEINSKGSFLYRRKQIWFNVVILTDLGQRQKSALNAENTTDLPKTLQMPSLCYCS